MYIFRLGKFQNECHLVYGPYRIRDLHVCSRKMNNILNGPLYNGQTGSQKRKLSVRTRMMLAAQQKVENYAKLASEIKTNSSESVEGTTRLMSNRHLPYLSATMQESQISEEFQHKITKVIETTCAVEIDVNFNTKATCRKSKSKTPEVGVLDFSRFNLGYAGVLHVLNEIYDYDTSHIVKMDFSDCALDERGMSVVYRIVKLCKSVEELNISRNHLGRSGITWVAKLLQNTDISYLTLAHNGLNDSDMEVFLAFLPESDTIKGLDLSYNILGPYTGELVTKYLPVSSLRSLNLSHNEIGPEGIRQMVEGLQENDTLNELDLSWNYLYDKGMVAMADIILTVPLIKRISLNGNFISEVGAQHIAQSLRENYSLEVLNLAQNFIRSRGACALVRAVRSNLGSKLRLMDINGTLVSHEFSVMYHRMQMDKEGFEVTGFCVVGDNGGSFRRRKSSKFQ